VKGDFLEEVDHLIGIWKNYLRFFFLSNFKEFRLKIWEKIFTFLDS
jgi:hypothetical protein